MRNRRPVEVGSSVALIEPADSPAPRCFDAPHRLEEAVHRRLRSQPGLRFASLVIRRIPNGVCLEGVLESDAEHDICRLVRSIDGVAEVLNHLVVRQRVR
ncbi:MAG TPA: BON domain-containing protein [Planctomycetaceae bacterium]|nr:BON domain-containing protein [Planctomycetaceae bacterium]